MIRLDDREIRVGAGGPCARLLAMLEHGETYLVVCDVGSVDRADVAAINVLGRLRLTSRRFGCRFVVRGASRELRELLGLTGLRRVLPCVRPERSGPA